MDPGLQPLQLNTGQHADDGNIPCESAFNAADPGTSLLVDQRGVSRPQLGGFDIGAFEVKPGDR